MQSFGQQLRAYRRQCRDPQRGGLLTQERFGELIGDNLGDAGYSGAAVSDWERDKSKIHADDRAVLVAILCVLKQNSGLSTPEDGQRLLAAGNYRALDGDEWRCVFPSEQPASQSAAQPAPGNTAGRDHAQRILLEKVHSFWVDGVLKKSTAGAPILALAKAEMTAAVDHPWDDALGPALISAAGPAESDILTLFNAADRALLILGAPGCGKTMTLIALAGHLLETAQGEPQAPIPVILDISSWAKERRDLDAWIVEELTAKYQIPRRYGRRWLAEDALIFLLDGFDVLPPSARRPCITAVNRFRETHGLSGLAICSRSQEYLDCGVKFQLTGAVKIEPLDQAQLHTYLAGAEQGVLRQLVNSDPAVRQLAETPLMLNVLTAVAGDGPTVDAPLASGQAFSSPGGYDPLFAAYTRRMFRRVPAPADYQPDQTLAYLKWLAQGLEDHSQSIFLIEGIQPSWLPSKRWRWVYMLLSGLISGLAGGVIIWLLWRLLRYSLPQLPAAVSEVLAGWFHLAREPVELLTILLGNLALGLLVGITSASSLNTAAHPL